MARFGRMQDHGVQDRRISPIRPRAGDVAADVHLSTRCESTRARRPTTLGAHRGGRRIHDEHHALLDATWLRRARTRRNSAEGTGAWGTGSPDRAAKHRVVSACSRGQVNLVRVADAVVHAPRLPPVPIRPSQEIERIQRSRRPRPGSPEPRWRRPLAPLNEPPRPAKRTRAPALRPATRRRSSRRWCPCPSGPRRSRGRRRSRRACAAAD